jgi:hypothetical protein
VSKRLSTAFKSVRDFQRDVVNQIVWDANPLQTKGCAMAAIILKGTPKQKRNYQRELFNAAVRALAPIVAALRAEGVIGVEEMRDRLNADGLVAPSGGKFSTGAMYRIQVRLAELNLGPPSRSVSRALSDRSTRRHQQSARLVTEITEKYLQRRHSER